MTFRFQAGLMLLMALWFAGCGQKEEPSPNPTTAPPSSQSETPSQDTQVAGDRTSQPGRDAATDRPTDPAASPQQQDMPPVQPKDSASPAAPNSGESSPAGDKPQQPSRDAQMRAGGEREGAASGEPVTAPAFPSPDKINKVEEDPPVPERQERKPMSAPPEAKGLVRVTPEHDVWLDGKNKRVILGAKVVLREGPLELFCTLAEQKEHEAILSVLAEAYFVHAALVSFGFDPGQPVQFRPEYKPAQGPEVEITVHWTDANGKRQSARGQDWVRNTETGKSLEYPWVFGGSRVWMDPDTGQAHYLAEGGDFICVSNFPSAMIDLPIRSTDTNAALLYEAFSERIPPRGTEVALVLTPKPWKKPAAADDGPVEAPAVEEAADAAGDQAADEAVEAPSPEAE